MKVLTERRKKSIFHTCLHELGKEEYGCCLLDFFKEQRDNLFIFLSEEGESEPPDNFKIRLKGLLKFVQRLFHDEVIKPDQMNYQGQLRNFLQNINHMTSDIDNGIINLQRIDRNIMDWGGAKVIITSDKTRPPDNYCIFLCTDLAHVVSWLMYRLRDIAHSILDGDNKYEFYGTIGQSACEFVKKNGDSDNQAEALVLYILTDVRNLIENWMRRFPLDMPRENCF